MSLRSLQDQFVLVWEQAVDLWMSGGWAMIAIAVVALVIFGVGMHIHVRLRATGLGSVREKVWRRWIESPEERRGPVGDIMNFVMAAWSIEEMGRRFDQLRSTEIQPFRRDLLVMKICVSAAPLLGLLGTVTGMLATFGALATGSGGDQTMSLVAGGISEALITTETGLIIALPGVFFQYQLARRFDRYKAFVAHVETVCTQALYHRIKAGYEAQAAVLQPQNAVESVADAVAGKTLVATT